MASQDTEVNKYRILHDLTSGQPVLKDSMVKFILRLQVYPDSQVHEPWRCACLAGLSASAH